MALYCSPGCRQLDAGLHQQGLCGAPWTRAVPSETVLACKLALLASQVLLALLTGAGTTGRGPCDITHAVQGDAASLAALDGLQAHQPSATVAADAAASACLAAACLATCAGAGGSLLAMHSTSAWANTLRQRVLAALLRRRPGCRAGRRATPVSAQQVFSTLLLIRTNAIAVVPLQHAGAQPRLLP